MGALLELTYAFNWEKIDGVTPEAAAAVMQDLFDRAVQDEACMIGAIIPYVTASAPDGTLPCDGATHLRVDYPELYAVLDSAFVTDADHFTTPDLRGRTVIGTGTGTGLTARAVNDMGGEENHTLTTAEMPSHNHSIGGTLLSSTVVPPPLDGLSPSIPTVTGTTGGDGSHNNMQPFTALSYALIAR